MRGARAAMTTIAAMGLLSGLAVGVAAQDDAAPPWFGGRVEMTEPLSFSVDETLDVGCEGASMVTEDYTSQTSKFNGRINWIQLDQGVDDHDHLISPEERLRVAMIRQ